MLKYILFRASVGTPYIVMPSIPAITYIYGYDFGNVSARNISTNGSYLVTTILITHIDMHKYMLLCATEDMTSLSQLSWTSMAVVIGKCHNKYLDWDWSSKNEYYPSGMRQSDCNHSVTDQRSGFWIKEIQNLIQLIKR